MESSRELYNDNLNLDKDTYIEYKQARKPRSYASSKLSPTHSLTGVRCRATSVAENIINKTDLSTKVTVGGL